LYSISKREIQFLNLFRRFRVETLWVEVRENPDRIVSFIYVPSGRDYSFIFRTKLREIAPIFVLLPFGSDAFRFEVLDRKGRRISTVLTKWEILQLINNDWDTGKVKDLLASKPLLLVEKGIEYYPKTYDSFKAKRIYSNLHFKAKKDAYMFDIDVALMERTDKDFVALLEYKHGRETDYNRDYLSYNEKVGYSILKDYYKTFLVVGTNSFSIYELSGFDYFLVAKTSREKLEEELSLIIDLAGVEI